MADETTQAIAADQVAETPSSESLANQLEQATSRDPGGDEGAAQAAAAIAPAAAAAEATWTGVREYAKSQGLDLPYDDDAAALNDLIRARRQVEERNYYAELGQRLAPHGDAIGEFLRARQAPKAEPPPWAPPAFDAKWLAMVERDETTGALRAKPGYDPAVADRVTAYSDWRDKFLQDPAATLAPLVEDRARAIVREEQARYQQDATANDLVRRNAAWMFQADAEGRPLLDARGQRQLTPAGVHYARAAKDLWDAGLRDVRRIDAYATDGARAAALMARYQADQAATPPVGTPNGTTPPTSVGGNQTRPAAGLAQPAPSQAGLSLQEMLKRNLDNAGITDDLML